MIGSVGPTPRTIHASPRELASRGFAFVGRQASLRAPAREPRRALWGSAGVSERRRGVSQRCRGVPATTDQPTTPVTNALPGAGTTLDDALRALRVPEDLRSLVLALAKASARVSGVLRTAAPTRAGTANDFGDLQLEADVACDDIIFEELDACGRCAVAASEERSRATTLAGSGFAVAFDPLDGSSIFSANLAVGTIAAVWRGDILLGVRGREAAASVAALYGPRTTLCVAFGAQEDEDLKGLWGKAVRREPATSKQRGQHHTETAPEGADTEGTGEGSSAGGNRDAGPSRGGGMATPGGTIQPLSASVSSSEPDRSTVPPPTAAQQAPHAGPDRARAVHEFVLDPASGDWLLSRRFSAVRPAAALFAPGNLRGAGSSPGYRRLLDRCISSRFSLRYSGGMVPDVLQILALGQGVFFNAPGPGSNAKLRLLYEVAPLAFLVEAAGGASSAGAGGRSALDMICGSFAQVTDVCLGSADEVARYVRYVRGEESGTDSEDND